MSAPRSCVFFPIGQQIFANGQKQKLTISLPIIRKGLFIGARILPDIYLFFAISYPALTNLTWFRMRLSQRIRRIISGSWYWPQGKNSQQKPLFWQQAIRRRAGHASWQATCQQTGWWKIPGLANGWPKSPKQTRSHLSVAG